MYYRDKESWHGAISSVSNFDVNMEGVVGDVNHNHPFDISKPEQCGRHVPDDIFKAFIVSLDFGKGWVILSHTLQWLWLLIHAGIKLIYVSKGDSNILPDPLVAECNDACLRHPGLCGPMENNLNIQI